MTKHQKTKSTNTQKLIIPFLVFFLMPVFSAMARAQTDGSLTLARNKTSAYRIVLPADAIPSENHAAQELRDYLEQISGARLEIATETDAMPAGPRIYAGPGKAAMQIIGEQAYKSLGAEGFILRTAGADLIIAGGRPRGTLYGVYTLLEDHLGCRWYAPGATVVPKSDTVTLPPLDETRTPAFEYREPFFYHAFDADWAARNKANGSTPKLDEKHGGKISYSHFVHTFNSLVPPEKYFDAHPEYYTETKDPAMKDKLQICVANPDALDIAKKQTLQWMRETPEATIFSVSQNDNMNYCRRADDAAIEKAEGSPAGPLLLFVNNIADAVAAEFPDKAVDTLAYQYTENAPRTVRPRPNVIIRLCHMAPSCDTHSLEKCLWNANYVKNLKEWTAISDRVYVWHYVTDFQHYLMPFPDVKAITRDIPFYHKHGVKGFFAQGSYQSQGGNLAELKAWLIAKLLWNPGADSKALIHDFMNGYYGPAGPDMESAFYALHRGISSPIAHAHLYSSPSVEFLPRAALVDMDACFDRAEKLVAAQPEILDRVRRDRLGLTFVKLFAPHIFGWTRDDLKPGGPQDQRARFEQFEKDLTAFNITRLHEMYSRNESLQQMREAVERQIK